MLRIFFHGQKVPNWLETQKPILGYENNHTPAELTFTSLVLVWAWRGQYRVANLLFGSHMKISRGRNVMIIGQSPPGGKGAVYHYQSLFSALGLQRPTGKGS